MMKMPNVQVEPEVSIRERPMTEKVMVEARASPLCPLFLQRQFGESSLHEGTDKSSVCMSLSDAHRVHVSCHPFCTEHICDSQECNHKF